MGKFTRGAGGRHAGMYVAFAPRTNEWHHVLRPLFRGWPCVVSLATVAVIVMVLRTHGYTWAADAALVVGVVLFAFSFRLVWVLARLVVFVVKFAIRARAELTVATTVLAFAVALRSVMPAVWVDTILVTTAVAVLAVPVSRRFVAARLWCVLDRHRLRVCLVQTKVRTMNLDGALPLMLWARPTKTGERIWLWIRAGACGGDVQAALDYIAPACYARQARLHQVRRLSTLVAVDVIRRDPLSKPEPIMSVLTKYIPQSSTHRGGEGSDPIQPVSVHDITSAVVPTDDIAARKNTRNAKSAAAVPVPDLVVNGEDVSDYID